MTGSNLSSTKEWWSEKRLGNGMGQGNRVAKEWERDSSACSWNNGP